MADEITDVKGRKLKLRDLTLRDQIKILRAIGAQHANNEPYVGVVTALSSIESIDGVPMPPMLNEGHIDQMCDTIGTEGLAALIARTRRLSAELEERARLAEGQPQSPLDLPASSEPAPT